MKRPMSGTKKKSGRKRSPNYVPSEDEYQMSGTVKELKSEILRLLEENKMLRDKVDALNKKVPIR